MWKLSWKLVSPVPVSSFANDTIPVLNVHSAASAAGNIGSIRRNTKIWNHDWHVQHSEAAGGLNWSEYNKHCLGLSHLIVTAVEDNNMPQRICSNSAAYLYMVSAMHGFSYFWKRHRRICWSSGYTTHNIDVIPVRSFLFFNPLLFTAQLTLLDHAQTGDTTCIKNHIIQQILSILRVSHSGMSLHILFPFL